MALETDTEIRVQIQDEVVFDLAFTNVLGNDKNLSLNSIVICKIVGQNGSLTFVKYSVLKMEKSEFKRVVL